MLHQLANATSAAEALSRASRPAAPALIAAMDWGIAGSALGLETLQRALTLANRARDSMVGSALQAGLVQLLLARLDWRSGNGTDADNQVICLAHPKSVSTIVTTHSSIRAWSVPYLQGAVCPDYNKPEEEEEECLLFNAAC